MYKNKLDTVKYYVKFFLIAINIPLILSLVGIATVIKVLLPKRKFKDITDKVVLITGGGNGLGREISLRLADKKCKLAIVDIDEKAAKETLSLVKSKGEHRTYRADVSDFAQCQSVVRKVEEEMGPVDILISNAGIMPCIDFVDISMDQVEKTVGVNLMSSLYFIKLVMDKMLERNSGHIVCTSSIGGQIPLPGGSVYTLTKFGLTGFLEAFRVELAYLNKSVKVTTLQPYFLKTNQEISNFIENKIDLMIPAFDVDYVASEAVKGILREDKVVTISNEFNIMIYLFKVLPPFIKDFVLYLGKVIKKEN
ncbi:SDR16C5.2 family protein [Megaselia abdita]